MHKKLTMLSVVFAFVFCAAAILVLEVQKNYYRKMYRLARCSNMSGSVGLSKRLDHGMYDDVRKILLIFAKSDLKMIELDGNNSLSEEEERAVHLAREYLNECERNNPRLLKNEAQSTADLQEQNKTSSKEERDFMDRIGEASFFLAAIQLVESNKTVDAKAIMDLRLDEDIVALNEPVGGESQNLQQQRSYMFREIALWREKHPAENGSLVLSNNVQVERTKANDILRNYTTSKGK